MIVLAEENQEQHTNLIDDLLEHPLKIRDFNRYRDKNLEASTSPFVDTNVWLYAFVEDGDQGKSTLASTLNSTWRHRLEHSSGE